MNSVIKASLLLAGIIAVVSLGFTFSGFQVSSPLLGGLVFVVIAILANVGCLFWGLSGSAAESGYGKQLLNSLIFGVVAGVLILCVSMLIMTVLAPDHLDQIKTASVEAMEGMNMPEEALAAQVDRIEAITPMGEAIKGLIGTIGTSLFFGAIIAIFKRRK
jgi:hypothetical protein